MNITVERKWRKPSYTIGKMYIDGNVFCDTLEDEDRGLESTMSPERISNIKVYGETAIPSGTYEVRMTHSPRFSTRTWAKKYGGKVPELINVKGFSGIRIHPMNYPKDTLGCIGVGRNTVKGGITQSTEYYYKLLDDYILPAINRKEKILISVR